MILVLLQLYSFYMEFPTYSFLVKHLTSFSTLFRVLGGKNRVERSTDV